jgi:hypothetical protein
MKFSSTLKSTLLGIGVLCTTIVFAQKDKKSEKNKFLEGKVYNVNFTEIKAKPTGPPKQLPSVIIIKGGKVQCDLMEEKLTVPAIAYKVTQDTTYTEDDAEVRKVSFVAEYTEEKTGYKWNATITDFEIEGTCVMLKSGVEKKKFEFTGEEKTKKK